MIPLLNEERAIEDVLTDHLRVLAEIAPQISGFEIICLDDGSIDHTWEILQKLTTKYPQLRLLRNISNKGITASYHRLFNESAGEFIYLTAGDGQWPAENLRTLFLKLRETNADIVVGVRQDRQKVYNMWRRILSYSFNFLGEKLLDIKTKDANGVKIGRKAIFTEPVQSKSFFAEIERLFLAKHHGYKIVFAPVLFLSRSSGKEKGAKFSNVLNTFFELIIYSLWSRHRVKPTKKKNSVSSNKT